MKQDLDISKIQKIHFIGIGGVSMSGLAKWCRIKGLSVSGSDKKPFSTALGLQNLGIKVFFGHSAKNVVGAEAVVYTSAVPEDNEELAAAKKRGIPIIKRSELLGYILKKYPRSIAVSGSHGKTTVTAMLWEIFEAAGEKPAVFLGGEYGARGNFTAGGTPEKFALAEACEYKGNFLDIKPDLCVVLNVDNDHLESFGGAEAERAAFRKFASNGVSVINADDEGALKAAGEASVTFGIENSAMFAAKNLTANGKNGGYSFTVYEHGVRAGRVELKIRGRYNVYNALAAIAAARTSGISFRAAKKALSSFSGVKRRNERIGTFCGKAVFADYAHHPAEINAFLEGKKEEGKKYVAVFQPHTYSRTRILKEEFIKVLSREPRLIIYKTFPAREKFDKSGDAKTLYEEIYKERAKIDKERVKSSAACEEDFDCLKCTLALYAETKEELIGAIKLRLAGAEEILFVGAGDIYEIALSLCEKQRGKENGEERL